MAWSGEQLQNAALIYQTGRKMGMSSRDIQIGLMAAIVESGLVNVNYGDRDSLGLFQQRATWGSATQRMNPQYAAQKFFSSLRALGDRRNQMDMGAAAQAVQRSAYPGRYSQHIGDVRAMWPKIANMAGDTQQSIDGGNYDPNTPTVGGAVPQSKKMSQPTVGPTSTPTPDMLGAPPTNMLDAWDTSSPQQSQQALDAANRTIISPGTNESVIKPMAETSGGYTKGVDGWRKAVVQTAYQQLGTPYVWGGESTSGFDCSGLVQYVMNKVGKHLPRISYQQATSGTRVPLNKLRPGDLVAWDYSKRNGGADHIALYIGNGQIIEAAHPGTSVRVRSLASNEGAWGVSLG